VTLSEPTPLIKTGQPNGSDCVGAQTLAQNTGILFDLTTVITHFPSTRLTDKISTCSEQGLLDMRRVWEAKGNIYSAFF
jgi:hypothetical protein